MYRMWEYGKVIARRPTKGAKREALGVRRILFVCTGNTCRSPMAERLLRQMVDERLGEGAHQVIVESAGTWAADGEPGALFAETVMEEEEINLTGHRSRRLTAEMVRAADLILTMTTAHKAAVVGVVPDAAGRVFTLQEIVLGDEMRKDRTLDLAVGEIPDPIGGPIEGYRRCAGEIRKALVKGFERIVGSAAGAADVNTGSS